MCFGMLTGTTVSHLSRVLLDLTMVICLTYAFVLGHGAANLTVLVLSLRPVHAYKRKILRGLCRFHGNAQGLVDEEIQVHS